MTIVLVTGGAGFIGNHLCRKLLCDGNKVICMDNLITGSIEKISDLLSNENFIFIKHDICDPICLDENVKEIYHLASIASPEKYKKYPIETLKVGFVGTLNVLEFAKKNNSKALFTSTSEVYGDPLVHPQPESYYGNVNIVGERSCYDESKRVAETLMYEYQKHLDTKIVRIFNTYGPKMDMDDGRVITNLLSSLKNNTVFKICGEGTQTRSFCHVDDMVRGLILMMNSSEHGPINLGNPDYELTINELCKLFPEVKTEYSPATENDPKQRNPDTTLAIEKLGWKPIISLEEGIIELLKS